MSIIKTRVREWIGSDPQTGWEKQDSFFGSKILTAADLGSMILTVTGGTVTMFDPAGLSGRIGINVGSGILNIDRNGQAVGGDEGTASPDISALPPGFYILEIVSGGWTLNGYEKTLHVVPSVETTLPTLDWELHTAWKATLVYNTTMSFLNIKPGKTITAHITGGLGWGINYPTEVVWATGSSPGNPPAGVTFHYRFTAVSASLVYGFLDT